jgi:hypothetical protein
MVRASLVLFEDAAPQRLSRGLWMPLELAVPQHVVISDFSDDAAFSLARGMSSGHFGDS